jgi:hypothetical protein
MAATRHEARGVSAGPTAATPGRVDGKEAFVRNLFMPLEQVSTDRGGHVEMICEKIYFKRKYFDVYSF